MNNINLINKIETFIILIIDIYSNDYMRIFVQDFY